MSNKIEIGEYIRTEEGYILENTIKAHKSIIEKLVEEDREYKNKFGRITNHSRNIIDLIEVGDFVNGFIVNDTDKEMVSCCEYEIEFLNEDIKSILTHEQYEQNCYEVER